MLLQYLYLLYHGFSAWSEEINSGTCTVVKSSQGRLRIISQMTCSVRSISKCPCLIFVSSATCVPMPHDIPVTLPPLQCIFAKIALSSADTCLIIQPFRPGMHNLPSGPEQAKVLDFSYHSPRLFGRAVKPLWEPRIRRKQLPQFLCCQPWGTESTARQSLFKVARQRNISGMK